MKEVDKFLEKYNLPRLNQEETETVSRPITNTEIKTVILKKKNLPKTKAQGQMASQSNSRESLEKS